MFIRHVFEKSSLFAMAGSYLELAQSPDMIDVDMRCNGDNHLARGKVQRRFERHETHAGIDDQIDLSPANMKDIAPEKRMDMRLPYPRDVPPHGFL